MSLQGLAAVALMVLVVGLAIAGGQSASTQAYYCAYRGNVFRAVVTHEGLRFQGQKDAFFPLDVEVVSPVSVSKQGLKSKWISVVIPGGKIQGSLTYWGAAGQFVEGLRADGSFVEPIVDNLRITGCMSEMKPDLIEWIAGQ